MTLTIEDLKTIIEIFVACVFAEIFVIAVTDAIKRFRSRALDINCDNCEEAIPLGRTPDKKFYLCRNCMNAYLMEHESDFTEEQISKAKRGFRKIKRKRRPT